MTKTYEAHPATALLPMMSVGELNRLAQDIAEHGQKEPILLHEGRVIDGRARQAACLMAGKEPRCDDAQLKGEHPAIFVVRRNIERRNLTPSQRAAVGAELLLLLRQEAQRRKRKAKLPGPKSLLETFPELPAPAGTKRVDREARELVGLLVGVCGRTVTEAALLKKRAPEQYEQVRRGEQAVSSLMIALRSGGPFPPPVAAVPQASAPRKPRPTARNWNTAKHRMVDVLSRVRGLCKGVAEMNPAIIVPVLTGEERRAWVEAARKAAWQLRTFAQKLETSHDVRQDAQNQNDPHRSAEAAGASDRPAQAGAEQDPQAGCRI